MSDLMATEQTNVRTALLHLRNEFGSWAALARALKIKEETLSYAKGRGVPSVRTAYRIAKLVEVPIDDVLTGKYPAPGTCPYCGHTAESNADEKAS